MDRRVGALLHQLEEHRGQQVCEAGLEARLDLRMHLPERYRAGLLPLLIIDQHRGQRGETGITAWLEPTTIDGLVYASSMVVLYAARHRAPVPPSPVLTRPGDRGDPHGEHGPGLVPRSRRGGGRGRAGGHSRGLL